MTFFVCNVLLALLLGWLSYRYIEPIGQKIARRRRNKALRTAGNDA